MPREKECYRDNLVLIKEKYPDENMLTVKQVAKFTGKDYRTVKKLFKFNNGYISVANLASQMS